MIDPDFIDDIEMDYWSNAFDCSIGLTEEEMYDGCDYHDAIKSYQKSLSEYSLPSKCNHIYWLYAERQKGRYRKATKRSGKWLIFAPAAEIDALWVKVRELTERGKLGNDSKVSTKRGNKGRDHVICVYTYDWTDEADCMRIREGLREAGIEKPLPYKADADTLAGRYAEKGKTLSKYYV